MTLNLARKTLPNAFVTLSGLFLGAALLKFGNPGILEHAIQVARESIGSSSGSTAFKELLTGPQSSTPRDLYELIFQSWPLRWGYLTIGALTLAGIGLARFSLPRPAWLSLLPLAWLAWQIVSSIDTIDPVLTRITLLHFCSVVAWYYLGALALSRAPSLKPFWASLLVGFTLMILVGFEQRFGGLEATRNYIYTYVGAENLPPDYLKRLASNRIFATMVYPNALAGAIVLLLPAMACATWSLAAPLTKPTRVLLSGLIVLGGAACLYWSGSKAGWLIALLEGVVLMLTSRFPRNLKWAIAAIIILAGLTAFSVRFAQYFTRGAPSMGARIHYWTVALKVFIHHPLTGTGPGTFKVNYQRLKPPEAEMTRLVHNDYLEQACDSGLPGAVLYILFMWGTLFHLKDRCKSDIMSRATWLGLFGWSCQGLTEFSLYVPAPSWVAFAWFGMLMGRTGESAAQTT